MATLEGCVLDSLDINDGTTYRLHESLEIGPPSKRLLWLAGREGDVLGDVPGYERRTVTAKVRIWNTANMDAALAALNTLVQKIQKAERTDGGIALVWTPAGSTKSRTIYVLAGEVTGLPITPTSADSGWFKARPLITLRLDCKPFLYAAEITPNLYDSDPFARDTVSEGRWRFDTGSGTLSVSGGQLVPSSTAEKKLYRQLTAEDCTVTAKFTTGTVVTSQVIGVFAKRLDASNFIIALSQQSDNTLRVYKFDGAVYTSLASAAFTPSASTNYWIRLAMVGNVCTATVYTANPETGAVATQTASATLAGADATKFGTGIKGKSGIYLAPGDTNYRVDDWLATSAWWESSEPHIDAEIRGISGDVPAEARIILTDKATQERDYAEYGLEATAYDSTAPGPTIIDSKQLSISGLAGSANTRAGAYDPSAGGTQTVIRGTTATAWVGLCETGALSHVGSFRVKARVWSDSTDSTVSALSNAQVRAAWRVGDGALSRNAPVVLPVSSQWVEVDLGMVYLTAVASGTQRSVVRIEFKSPTSNKTLDVDYVELIPADRYGKARAPLNTAPPPVLAAQSGFDTESGVITGQALVVGGTWSALTGSDTDDFSVSAGVATRTAVGDTGAIATGVGRVIIASGSTLTDTGAKVDLKFSALVGKAGLVVRQSATGVYLPIYVDPSGSTITVAPSDLSGGASFPIAQVTVNTFYTLQVIVTSRGELYIYFGPRARSVAYVGVFNSTQWATGGTFASGKVGIYDENSTPTAATRTYDNFAVWAPENDAAIYSGKTIQFRYDDTLRDDSGGTILGRPQVARGARAFIPQAGSEGKISRIVAKAARNDIEAAPRDQIADALRLEVRTRGRSLVAPS